MLPDGSRGWWVRVGLALACGAALACSGSISSPDVETETGASTPAASGASGSADDNVALARGTTAPATGSGGSASAGSAGASASGAVSGSGAGRAGSGGSGTGTAAPSGGGDYCDAPGLIFNTDTCGSSDRGCHAEGSLNGEFGTDEGTVRALLDEESVYGAACGLYIDSDNPEESLLLTMTTGTQNAACYPLQMPLQSPPLTPEETDCIIDWLSQF